MGDHTVSAVQRIVFNRFSTRVHNKKTATGKPAPFSVFGYTRESVPRKFVLHSGWTRGEDNPKVYTLDIMAQWLEVPILATVHKKVKLWYIDQILCTGPAVSIIGTQMRPPLCDGLLLNLFTPAPEVDACELCHYYPYNMDTYPCNVCIHPARDSETLTGVLQKTIEHIRRNIM